VKQEFSANMDKEGSMNRLVLIVAFSVSFCGDIPVPPLGCPSQMPWLGLAAAQSWLLIALYI
jgi:hypothetical protein